VEYRNIMLYPRVRQMGAREKTTTVGDYVYAYSVKDGGASIHPGPSLGYAVSHITTRLTPAGGFSVPAALGGYPVTSVGNGAFAESGLTRVAFPPNVTSIGDSRVAFE